ncbi:MAG: response regulator transcription factor [Chloroflexi bacterium]|nr:response regulator transcription factor [Chloroflexota bacterium]
MASPRGKISLYIAEEQQILREAYQSFFVSSSEIEVVGSSGDTSSEALIRAVGALSPRVILAGIKVLQPAIVEDLVVARHQCPASAMVLLSASYDVKGITALREFPRSSSTGCAYLLKHTIDTVDQLIQVITSVDQGRIILDPTVMEALISTGENKTSYLKDLSPRELEVLSWMAKGYRNNTIAQVLCLEPKTVERHINNIYSKLGDIPDTRHTRVHAITLYLRATGQLPAEDFAEV